MAVAKKSTADSVKRTRRGQDYDDRFERGMAMLKRMGRETTMLDQKALDASLYDLSVGHLFGDIWTRPGLSLRERQLITLAANIACCRPWHTNHSHFRSAMHLGITKREIVELLIHVGHYAGWPTLSVGTDQFMKVLQDEAEKKKAAKKTARKKTK